MSIYTIEELENETRIKELAKRKGAMMAVASDLEEDEWNNFTNAFCKGFNIGFESAKDMTLQKLAVRMIKQGYTMSQIEEVTDYPPIYIESLQKENKI